MNRKLIPFIVIIFVQIACATLSPTEVHPILEKTTIPTQIQSASTLPVCNWYLETQVLRSTRIAKLNDFIEWYQKNAASGFDAITVTESEELIEILKTYQPYQHEFVQAWIDLGSVPEGEDFWEKELNSVELRIEAFDNLITGYETSDLDMINYGLDLFEKSQQAGRDSEAAMVQIHSMCTDQPKSESEDNIPISTTPILSKSELDKIVPDYWEESNKENIGLGEDACKIECYQNTWESDNSVLIITISKYENPTEAENELQAYMKIFDDEMNFEPVYMDRVDYLPDHTWFAVNDTDDDLYLYQILSQDQDFYVTVYFASFFHPDEELKEIQTRVVFLVAGEQWKKLFDMDEIEDISFIPIDSK